MLNGLLIILAPMFLGYLIKNEKYYPVTLINYSMMILLYIILFLMGFGSLVEIRKLSYPVANYCISAHFCSMY